MFTLLRSSQYLQTTTQKTTIYDVNVTTTIFRYIQRQ